MTRKVLEDNRDLGERTSRDLGGVDTNLDENQAADHLGGSTVDLDAKGRKEHLEMTPKTEKNPISSPPKRRNSGLLSKTEAYLLIRQIDAWAQRTVEF